MGVDRRSTRDLQLLWAKCLSNQAKACSKGEVPRDADLHCLSFSLLYPINELRGARWDSALDAGAQSSGVLRRHWRRSARRRKSVVAPISSHPETGHSRNENARWLGPSVDERFVSIGDHGTCLQRTSLASRAEYCPWPGGRGRPRASQCPTRCCCSARRRFGADDRRSTVPGQARAESGASIGLAIADADVGRIRSAGLAEHR